MLKLTFEITNPIYEAVKKRISTFLAGFVFAFLCFVALNAAMVPVSKSEYCGGKCYEMNKAYLAWELSSHGTNSKGIRVEWIDCHLPEKERYFAHITAKAYEGAKDMYKHYFGDEYDVEKIRLKVLSHLPNDRCLHCHDNLLARPGNSAARIAQQHYRTQKPRKIDVSSVMRMSGINFKINYFRRKGSLSG